MDDGRCALAIDRGLVGRWAAVGLLGVVLLFFWNSAVLWPIKILVVLFHELGHAAATWLTGGSVVEIGLNPRQGGHTLSQGGSRFIILNAGYLGSLLAGVALLMTTRSARASRAVAWLLAGVALGTAALWVRPLLGFGFLFTVATALGFAVLARYAATEPVRWVLRALGLFSVLYAAFDVRDDVFRSGGTSDAHMLAELTHVPAGVWGIGWLLVGFGVLWLLRNRIA